MRARYAIVRAEDSDSPTNLTAKYPTTSVVHGNRAVFRLKGGSYRLVVRAHYEKRIVYVRFIGTRGV